MIRAEKPNFIKVEKPKNGARQLVIADVHGCNRTLEALLKKLEYSAKDQLFFLGDLVNRGPDSAKVLDMIIGLKQSGQQVYTLRGNHEQILLDASKVSTNRLVKILKSRNSLPLLNKQRELKKRYRTFMEQTLHYIELDRFYLVHAGFNLAANNPFSDTNAMLWLRPFRSEQLLNGKQVIYGHNPRRWRDIKQSVELNLPSIGLDNGCVHTQLSTKYGRLVCLDLGTMELIKQRNCEEG